MSCIMTLLWLFVTVGIGFADTSIINIYDANGNLISGDGNYYEYNDANQLARVRQGDQSGPVIAEYFYDYSGQRVKKIENGVVTYYVGKHFEKQVGGSNAGNTSYYFGEGGERVAKKDFTGNVFYYHLDHLDGINVVTDAAGNLVARTDYQPFGDVQGNDDPGDKYSYTGKEKDKTALYYFEARYNSPQFRHFTQPDTAEPDYSDPQDLNRYAYAGNNPLSYVDMDGFKKKKKAKLSKREKWMIAHGVDPDKDKTSLKKAKEEFKAGEKYTTSTANSGKIGAGYSLTAGSAKYSFGGGGMYYKTNGFNGGLGSKSQYGVKDSIKDMLDVDKEIIMHGGKLVLSDMKSWKYVKGLDKVTSEVTTFLDLAVNTSDELGGIGNIAQAWQHGWENIRSATGDEWLDAMTHSAASAYAISANTIFSPLNAGLRLITGGHDLTVTGDETISAIQKFLGE
jgi:RHS repeat-associated protein